MLTNRSHSPLYLPLLIAVCGILFSVWNALDAASVPCVSAGCTLYQNFSINGYSLWWGGVGIFSLLGLLALTGRAVLGRWLAGLAVLLDCVLLGIMILTLPCVAFMVAALLLALCTSHSAPPRLRIPTAAPCTTLPPCLSSGVPSSS